METDILLVLPTYNEAENLPPLVSRILDLDSEQLRLLIIDDNSPDGTGKVADSLSKQHPGRIDVLHRKERGLGSAYIAGFKYALDSKARHVIGMDADLSHSPKHIPEMLEEINDCDIVVGSRYVSGGGVDDAWGFARRAFSWGAQIYIRLLLGIETEDATGAFRCYSRRALEQLRFDLMELDGYSFLIEIILQAERMGLRIKEIPITFYARNNGKSKVTLRIILDALSRIAMLRFKQPRLTS